MRLRAHSITARLTWTFALVIAITATAAFSIAYTSSRQAIEHEVTERLRVEATEKAESVERWLHERTRELQLRAHDLAQPMQQLMSTAQDVSLRLQLRDKLLTSASPGEPFALAMLLHPSTGEVLIASDPREEGKYKENREYFLRGKQGAFVQRPYYSFRTRSAAIAVSAPVRSDAGTLLAVLVGQTNLDELASISSRGILHASATSSFDSYLIDAASSFVTPSKFTSLGSVIRRINSVPMVESCLNGNSGTFSGLDYRGVPVLAAVRWLPGRRLCLIAQMDKDEALAPADALAAKLLTLAMVCMLGGFLVSMLLARGLSGPIMRLCDAARQFGEGRFADRLEEERKDELGVLASTFNSMAVSLQYRDQQIGELNASLERRVEERTRELHSAQRGLLKQERLATLGQLTATVSHEIRNPLAAMQVSLFTLRRQIDESNERACTALDVLERNARRCDKIIDELLDFTRTQELELPPTILDEWLSEIIDEQPVPANTTVESELGLSDLVVSFCPDRLRRAVINVFQNACHAVMEADNPNTARAGPRIHVTTARTHGRIELSVEDNGTGIAEDVLPSIFEPPFSTKSFGVGLGMSVVKETLASHGGGVEVHSRSQQGTRIVLWLPLSAIQDNCFELNALDTASM